MSKVKIEVALDDPDLSASSDTYTWTDWTAYVERDNIGVHIWRGYRDGAREASPTEIRFR